jgi:hypothetical protein
MAATKQISTKDSSSNFQGKSIFLVILEKYEINKKKKTLEHTLA